MSLTVGTNTYVTLAEANSYFGDRADAAKWFNGNTTNVLEDALITATKRLNQSYYQGRKDDPNYTNGVANQALAFPRSGLYDRDGIWLESTVVPQDIKDAQCELALAIINGDITLSQEISGNKYESIAIGSLSVKYRTQEPTATLPDIVQRLLSPYLDSANRVVRT